MKLTKLSLAMTTIFGVGVATEALALDLYVDSKTQQIFAEPGPGRTKLGTFQRVEDAATQQAEVDAQKAEIAKIKDDLALKSNELKALDEHMSDPTEGKLHMDEKGVKFESKDGNFDMAITGRMQIDSQVNAEQHPAPATGARTTNALADGMAIRRARLGVEGSYYKDYGYKFEYDFTRGNGSTASGVTDAFLSWKGYDPLLVTIGQYKEYFSMEETTSNRYLTFIERNMATNAFSDNFNAYKMGLGLAYSQPRWLVSGGFQTESIGNGGPTFDASSTNSNFNANRNNGSGDTGWGVTGRMTALPWFEDKTKFLHVGASGSQRYPNTNVLANGTGTGANGAGPRFGSFLNDNVDRTLILDTGFLSSNNGAFKADKIARFGGETAFVYGPFSAQAEYMQAEVSGSGYNDNNLNGAYGYMSYFLTGESRAYKPKTGAWDRIKPKQNFTAHGGLGAWELAVGYDHLDLNSGVIHGGRASSGKVGLNWYPNSRVRFMANFIHYLDINTANTCNANSNANIGVNASAAACVANNGANYARTSSFNGTHPDVFELRGQIDF